jgi:hypothetical protein
MQLRRTSAGLQGDATQKIVVIVATNARTLNRKYCRFVVIIEFLDNTVHPVFLFKAQRLEDYFFLRRQHTQLYLTDRISPYPQTSEVVVVVVVVYKESCFCMLCPCILFY